MDYSEFKESVFRYLEDNFDSTYVIHKRNNYLEEKVFKHMFKLMYEEFNPAPEDCMELMDQCKEYTKRFFDEHLEE